MDTVHESSSSSASVFAHPGRLRTDSFIPLEGMPERFQSYQFVPYGYVRGEKNGVPGFVRDIDPMFLPTDNRMTGQPTSFPADHPELDFKCLQIHRKRGGPY